MNDKQISSIKRLLLRLVDVFLYKFRFLVWYNLENREALILLILRQKVYFLLISP